MFLASCQTTPDVDGAAVWLENNGYEVHNRPEVVHVHRPADQARYVPGENVIELSHKWGGSTPEKALLIHELVHAQQDTTGHQDIGVCLALETEAYGAMQKYLEAQGARFPDFFAEYGASVSCEPTEWAKRHRMVLACKARGGEVCDPRDWKQ